MKLITWNCQGAFRRKAEVILKHNPDILVVQECEHTDKLNFNSTVKLPTTSLWYGDNMHKGIGVYLYSDYHLELLPQFNPSFRYVLPVRVSRNGCNFTLLAIWAMHSKENYQARYIGQVWLAIDYYASLLTEPVILVGDFNSNKIWDIKSRVGNHSDVVCKLAENDIYSIYHQHFDIEQGKELHPTFFLQRKQSKQYHIDYCFVSRNFINNVKDVEIGAYSEWVQYSDHTPLIVTFNY